MNRLRFGLEIVGKLFAFTCSYQGGNDAERKGLIEALMDFSFSELVTTRMIKLLYGLHLFLGLIVAVAVILNGFRTSTADGLLMLILSALGLFLWVLYVRVWLEVLITVFRIAENIAYMATKVG